MALSREISRLHAPLAPTRARARPSNSLCAKCTPPEDRAWPEFAGDALAPGPRAPARFPERGPAGAHMAAHSNLVRGAWTREEDEAIVSWVDAHGTTGWTKLAAGLPGRIGKQCRERWHNGLNPELTRRWWAPEEDQLIEQLQEKWGNKWSKIAEFLPGRTDNAIKNRWNSTLKQGKRAPDGIPTSTMFKDESALQEAFELF
jgi:hypothetical protein